MKTGAAGAAGDKSRLGKSA